MINITSIGTPVAYQNDLSYSQPTYTGPVQWNGNVKKFQVSNGSGWSDINNNIQITTSSDLESVISWAKKKMQEEEEIKQLASKYPPIADLLKDIEESTKKIKMLKVLVE